MKALIVVDMQNDFIDGALANEAAQAILPEICALIKDYTDAGDMVVLTQDTHYDDYMTTLEGKKLPVAHCIHGTHGWQFHPAIEAVLHHTHLTIQKDTFGAYDLADCIDNYLDEYCDDCNDLESITFVGVCTGICVISNVAIARANYPEVPIFVRADACACVTPETHNQALEAMKVFQIDILEG